MIRKNIIIILFLSILSYGQIPSTISYQGVLTNPDGSAISDTSATMHFNLYDADINGNMIWSETQQVQVNEGLFNVILGIENPLKLPFDKRYWLGVRLNDNSELEPRIELTSVPYSLNTRSIPDGIVDSLKIADGQVVRSINELSDKVKLVEGNNIKIEIQGNSLIISAGDVSGGNGGNSWNLTGNNNIKATDFIGTINNMSLNFKVNNQLVYRMTPNATSPIVIGGHASNSVSVNAAGGTIAGGGPGNKVNEEYGYVGGGLENSVLNFASTVGGGRLNEAGGSNATIGGGKGNKTTGNFSSIGGGIDNQAMENASTIAGGEKNTASGNRSHVGGGIQNTASAYATTISGGQENVANSSRSSVGGGISNIASGPQSRVGGGQFNEAGGAFSFIGGGGYTEKSDGNLAPANYSTIGGGRANNAAGISSVIGGGYKNMTEGQYSTVPGGANNQATGRYSFAAGNRAKAMHDGAFIWADGQAFDYTSTANNQFLIRASGGVGIGTNNPAGPLHILSQGIPPTGLAADNNGLLLGMESTSGYKWIQSYGGDLVLNANGNNVGIGLTEPEETLDVAGNVKAVGYTQSGNGGETLRIIRGNVNAAGEKFGGSGFTSSFVEVGVYKITFLTAFSSQPSVTVTPHSTYAVMSTIDSLNNDSIIVRIFQSYTGTNVNRGFSFIAIGVP